MFGRFASVRIFLDDKVTMQCQQRIQLYMGKQESDSDLQQGVVCINHHDNALPRNETRMGIAECPVRDWTASAQFTRAHARAHSSSLSLSLSLSLFASACAIVWLAP